MCWNLREADIFITTEKKSQKKSKNFSKKCKNSHFEHLSSLYFTAACLQWKIANVKSDIYVIKLFTVTVIAVLCAA